MLRTQKFTVGQVTVSCQPMKGPGWKEYMASITCGGFKRVAKVTRRGETEFRIEPRWTGWLPADYEAAFFGPFRRLEDAVRAAARLAFPESAQ